jgi:hypothetical protein
LGDKHLETIAHAQRLHGNTKADVVRAALLLLCRRMVIMGIVPSAFAGRRRKPRFAICFQCRMRRRRHILTHRIFLFSLFDTFIFAPNWTKAAPRCPAPRLCRQVPFAISIA